MWRLVSSRLRHTLGAYCHVTSCDLQGDFLIMVCVTSTIKTVLTDIPLLLLELGHVLVTKQ